MNISQKKPCLKQRSVSLCCAMLLAVMTSAASAADSTTVTITATVVATCSLSAPAMVDLGDIPASAFDGLDVTDEVQGYDSSLLINTSCSGTDKYSLQLRPSWALYDCLIADPARGGMGFCFYDENNEKVALTSGGATLERNRGTDVALRVVPMRTGVPVTGTHSGTLTVTISPL